ncbi:hypothetical protein BDZ91DRAFT_647331 [Kalaharituber pfeilii]|nr:hypothetical protein BDZ91DRAFT_647331 [Kalaharituber pfeilii]
MVYNYNALKQHPWSEVAGSLGDLGVLLPIMTALAKEGMIDINSTLIFSGLFNIISGIIFGIPIAVQPMKAVASMALFKQLRLEQTMGAGIGVGVVILLLSATGLIESVDRMIPIPIVKGIQVGAGLSLTLNAGLQLSKLPWWDFSLNTHYCTILAGLVLFATWKSPRFPTVLIFFLIGMAYAISYVPVMPGIGIHIPRYVPNLQSYIFDGFMNAGVGQIPLTLLNSIIAVRHLSVDLLPLREPPSVTGLGMSVAFMNLTSCFFGSMPVCHGSGGLAAQHRFGARSGASVIILGIVKLLLGLSFGEPLVQWLDRFPTTLLGVMIFTAGIELASVGSTLNTTAPDIQKRTAIEGLDERLSSSLLLSEQEASERWALMTITASALIGFKDSSIGFVTGCTFWLVLRLRDILCAMRAKRRVPLDLLS